MCNIVICWILNPEINGKRLLSFLISSRFLINCSKPVSLRRIVTIALITKQQQPTEFQQNNFFNFTQKPTHTANKNKMNETTDNRVFLVAWMATHWQHKTVPNWKSSLFYKKKEEKTPTNSIRRMNDKRKEYQIKFHIVNKRLWEKLQTVRTRATRKTQRNIKINFLNLKFSFVRNDVPQIQWLHKLWKIETHALIHTKSNTYIVLTVLAFQFHMHRHRILEISSKFGPVFFLPKNVKFSCHSLYGSIATVICCKKKRQFYNIVFPKSIAILFTHSHAPWASNSIKYISLHWFRSTDRMGCFIIFVKYFQIFNIFRVPVVLCYQLIQ